MLGHFSRVQLFAVLWGVAHKTPLCMGFSRQECCSGLSCPPPGDLPHPRFKLASAFVSCPAGGFFTPWATWEALFTSEPSSNSKLCNCCWIIEYMCKNVLHHKEWKKKKNTTNPDVNNCRPWLLLYPSWAFNLALWPRICSEQDHGLIFSSGHSKPFSGSPDTTLSWPIEEKISCQPSGIQVQLNFFCYHTTM